ncbi:zinc-ribbon domain-containing protein [Pseudobutyrivibrio sp. YE44]|uniref:zinc ribbon domain-containing protein n=1 Tax=Pseudobutyrivibrio sp. YE44 TaxID=1520802 RepID=UPI0008872B78|nr:zinc ribbon domain-containing protein [Pseudobutyrivibrio sp. YE44]SDB23102.1 zinc-ribbon domain-containing protein [Pseudobutyrivibrio sp. YE44]
MFCENCGKELKPGDMFCENCGAKVPATSIPTEPKAAETQPAAPQQAASMPVNQTTATVKPAKKGFPVALVIIIVIAVIALISACVIGFKLVGKFFGAHKDDIGIETVQQEKDDKSSEGHSGKVKIPEGEFHPEYYEDLERYDFMDTQSEWPGGDDFIIFEGSKFAAYCREDTMELEGKSFEENPLSDKEFEYFQTYENQNNAIICDGKCYIFNQFSEGFHQLDDKACCPTAIDEYNTIYVIASEEDPNVGTLYCEDSLRDKVTEIATNVVASSIGFTFDGGCGKEVHFYYQKNVDGKLALCESTVPEDAYRTGNDYTAEEHVLVEGNCVPLADGIIDDGLFYLDKDTQTIKFQNKDEVKSIYQGDYDEYYTFGRNKILIVSGDELYYFADSYNIDEATLVLDTGLDSISHKGCITKRGFADGYQSYDDIQSVVINDKKGNQYFIIVSGTYVEAVELTHKTTEPGTDYFSSCRLLYIENGVLLMDKINLTNVETYVVYDANRVVDYCVSADGRDLFIYTGDASLYYYNRDKEEYILIDTDVEYNEEYGANIACDPFVNYMLYGKDGEMKGYYPLEDERDIEMLDLPHGVFAREGMRNYFYSDGSDQKKLVYNRHMCWFY